MPLAARCDDFAERVRASFARQGFMDFLSARLGRVEPGIVEIHVPFRHELTQQHGYFHGGVTATLVDNAGGYAAFSLMSRDEQPLSVEFKLNLLAKGDGDELVARAEVIRDGRTLKVCRVDVHAVSAEARTLCATGLITVIALPERTLPHADG